MIVVTSSLKFRIVFLLNVLVVCALVAELY